MYSSEYKQQVYQKWVERGRPWFNIDPQKEPTYAERQIILEMKKQENTRANRDLELERSVKPVNEVKAFHRLFRDIANY